MGTLQKRNFKKKPVYTEKYRRGVFETNRKKVSEWALNPNVWIEVREGGVNDDDTEFITVTFNNVPKPPNHDK